MTNLKEISLLIFKILILLPALIDLSTFFAYGVINWFMTITIILCILTVIGLDNEKSYIRKLCYIIGSIIVTLVSLLFLAIIIFGV